MRVHNKRERVVTIATRIHASTGEIVIHDGFVESNETKRRESRSFLSYRSSRISNYVIIKRHARANRYKRADARFVHV